MNRTISAVDPNTAALASDSPPRRIGDQQRAQILEGETDWVPDRIWPLYRKSRLDTALKDFVMESMDWSAIWLYNTM